MPPSPDAKRLTFRELLAVAPAPQTQRQAGQTSEQRGPARQRNAQRTIVIERDVSQPITVRSGRRGGSFVDPYTGEQLDRRNPWVNQFFSVVLRLHRWFNISGDGRPYAKFVNGVGNLVFLFLAISGLYLWFPRKWITPVVKTRFIPHFRHALPRARDYNWHHAMGFWAAIPLVVLIVTGSVFSFRWTGDLIYASLGIERPAPPQRAAQSTTNVNRSATIANNQVSERTQRNSNASQRTLDDISQPRNIRRGNAQGGEGRSNESQRPQRRRNDASLPTIESLTTTVLSDFPNWQRVSITVPQQPGLPATFLVDAGNGGQPQLRNTVSINQRTGEVLEVQTFAEMSPGLRVRGVIRFLHTGEIFGLLGQTIAGLASLIGVVMVWTGSAMAYRRLIAPALARRRLRRVHAETNPIIG